MIEINKIYNDDCFNVFPLIDDKSIDMILCDLPYGTTACKWDTIIPFEPLWKSYKRIIKDNGVIVLMGSQPFTSKLVMSNLEMFKYEWIWKKSRPTGFFTAKKIPMKIHENILVFYKKMPTYNPIKMKADENKIDKRKTLNSTYSPYLDVEKGRVRDNGMRYPLTIQNFNSISEKGQHPAQKPVELFSYLIKTYTNECDLVLDNCSGSGTTAISAINTKRNYICIEKEKKYYDISIERINDCIKQLKLF